MQMYYETQTQRIPMMLEWMNMSKLQVRRVVVQIVDTPWYVSAAACKAQVDM